MKVYVVGGAVRDELLGLPVADRDWVVVGTTPEQMAALGYRPVGRDFPVFLHPATHEEYALARTERKSGRGYRGFTVYSAPEVTLEQDLARRDLTINAMAKDESGALIDPFNGAADLKAGILRHVSDAFEEDPVRILRVARFAARFGFRVADETLALMKRMVEAGEVEHLVPERVWQEFARGLGEHKPMLMFELLEQCGARQRLLAELVLDLPARAALGRAAEAGAPLPVRFALLAWALPRDCESRLAALCARLRTLNAERELAELAIRCRDALLAAHDAAPGELLDLLRRADAFRRAERFDGLLAVARLAVAGAAMGRGIERARRALDAAAAVDAGAVAARAGSPAEIPGLIDAARQAAIRDALGG